MPSPSERVPAEWTIPGPRSWEQASDPVCKVCDQRYSAHSGNLCAICGDPVEHHDPGTFEVRCLDGRRRMARARFLADVTLNEWDELALADG